MGTANQDKHGTRTRKDPACIKDTQDEQDGNFHPI
jgi:hypothetical protein